jgi:hypothetical protein
MPEMFFSPVVPIGLLQQATGRLSLYELGKEMISFMAKRVGDGVLEACISVTNSF